MPVASQAELVLHGMQKYRYSTVKSCNSREASNAQQAALIIRLETSARAEQQPCILQKLTVQFD